MDKKKRISIRYPQEWEITEGYHGSTVLIASPLEGPLDFFQENVNVVIQDISAAPHDLKEFTDVAIGQMELVFLHNFILEESSHVATLSGYPAYKVIFTAKGPPEMGIDFRYYMIWTVLDDVTAYQVTYTAMPNNFDKYWAEVEKMVSSFKILKKR